MGTAERRARERQVTRERILEAARELFAKEGFEAVSMRKIAERIEYSPTAIYFHFKDKIALLRELCDSDFQTLREQFIEVAQVRDPIERLRRAGSVYVDFAIKQPNHYRLMFMTPHPELDPKTSKISHGNPDEDAYAFVKATVLQALDERRFRPGLDDADLITQTVWAGVHGICALHIAKGCDRWVELRDPQQATALMVEALMRGLLRADGGKK
jgi:AcrR family transcriptional regulator